MELSVGDLIFMHGASFLRTGYYVVIAKDEKFYYINSSHHPTIDQESTRRIADWWLQSYFFRYVMKV
jgi:hypothetical protein